MGVSYRGVLCVGYTYKQAEELYEECEDENGDYKYEDFYDFCENEGLESFSPYFDADKEDCIYGSIVVTGPDYSVKELLEPAELSSSILHQINDLQKQFFMQPKAYIMVHGW